MTAAFAYQQKVSGEKLLIFNGRKKYWPDQVIVSAVSYFICRLEMELQVIYVFQSANTC